MVRDQSTAITAVVYKLHLQPYGNHDSNPKKSKLKKKNYHFHCVILLVHINYLATLLKSIMQRVLEFKKKKNSGV